MKMGASASAWHPPADDIQLTANEVKGIIGEDNFDQRAFDKEAILGTISVVQLKAKIAEGFIESISYLKSNIRNRFVFLCRNYYVVADPESATKLKVLEKPSDKRSGMIDRHRAPHQVLCYICCAEYGTSSLGIHQKTCIKKHSWGLQNVLDDEKVSKKQAAANRKKCIEPGSGPSLPLPNAGQRNTL